MSNKPNGSSESNDQHKSKESDFEKIQKLGQGSFGIVYKVKRKQDGLIYVLKQIDIR